MTTNENLNNASSTGRAKRFFAVKSQLSSTDPDEFRQGIEHLRRWLQVGPDDQDIYTFMVNISLEFPTVQNAILELLREMKQRGSKIAAATLADLSTNEQDLMDEADDAYYAAEFDKAISLYKKVLDLEPNNHQARDRLVKAEANKIDGIGERVNRKPPREALQWFRQARSYIAASDFKAAIIYLGAAVEEARAKEIYFSDAELLLNRIQNLFNEATGNINEHISSKYDVFISYSHKDEIWVQSQLLTFLESKKISVCIDFRDFHVGAPSITEMERAVIQSRKTIIVLTPDYAKSAWAEFENILAQTLDPAAHSRTLLPILLKPCDLPLRIKALTYLDFTQPDKMSFQLDRLVNAIIEQQQNK
ncbi:MAG: toll/interleukin-1 receptor domain-containing protein [Chloroflexota bacterium]